MIDPGGCVVANTEHVRSLLSDLDGFTAAEVIVNPLGVRVLVLQCVQAQGWPDRGVVTGQVHSGRTMACGTCRAAVCGWCAGTSGGCSATSVAAHGGPSSNARSVVSAAAADRPAAGGAGAGTRVRGGPPARCREYGVSWWSVSQALVAVTAGVCRRLPRLDRR